MRLAIISDIHANLPALEQTLKSIEENEIDAIYCLGDLVGYNIWPNAVINEIRKQKIPTICGNHDEKAVAIHQYGRFLNDDANFAYNIIGKPQVQYLATLPAFIRLEFIFNGKPFTLMLVHGSPYSNKEYLHKEKEESELAAIFLDKGIDMLVFGHTHKPYYRIIDNGYTDQKFHAVNAGSVGKPKDGDKRGCYTIIALEHNNKLTVAVEFVRVAYDVEKAAQAIENSPLPPSYALMLRKAY
ncbi:metallophosphoesterase [Flavobacterium sp. ZE23DGlu08]|uniref:metallophosphoesterase family protein n=1 Tax=Flavobacterium sp. ZE23DGlu08 TaxID=3059026 RepID=UPI00265E4CB8|nr:metallophosphoesterase family protein [Flavobacterium sp. ZE23DGlu08]WKL44304.1 metallophosphoesterase family protein [Flavobacterium sp. ZE23DGlu08]